MYSICTFGYGGHRVHNQNNSSVRTLLSIIVPYHKYMRSAATDLPLCIRLGLIVSWNFKHNYTSCRTQQIHFYAGFCTQTKNRNHSNQFEKTVIYWKVIVSLRCNREWVYFDHLTCFRCILYAQFTKNNKWVQQRNQSVTLSWE